MKKMTCQQMGGPCDTSFTAGTAEEMMQLGADHIREMAATGDEAHKEVEKMMEETMQTPGASDQWNADFAAKFASLPDEM
jgi:hypothetical protein